MSGFVHSALLRLSVTEPPVVPDREEARRWAIEELAKAPYREAEPNWLEDLWRQFLDWLRSLQGEGPGPANDLALPLIGALAIVLVIVAVLVVRPRLNARKKEDTAVFDDGPSLDAATYRERAAAAAGAGNWQSAVVEQFRALVRSAEERDVIEVQAGRTADEVAAELAAAFSTAGQRLGAAALLFDAVRYGGAEATAADHHLVKALDADLSAMRPDYAGQAGPGLAVPR